MKILYTLLLMLAINVIASAEPAGVILHVSGDAWVQQTADRVDAVKSLLVEQSDKIITGSSGRVQVLFRDDSTMGIGPDTELELTDFDFDETSSAPKFALNITKGVVRVVSGKIVQQNPDGFGITTPHASISIRGTTITAVVGLTGTSTIINKMSIGKEVIVRNLQSGQTESSATDGVIISSGDDGSISKSAATEEQLGAGFGTGSVADDDSEDTGETGNTDGGTNNNSDTDTNPPGSVGDEQAETDGPDVVKVEPPLVQNPAPDPIDPDPIEPDPIDPDPIDPDPIEPDPIDPDPIDPDPIDPDPIDPDPIEPGPIIPPEIPSPKPTEGIFSGSFTSGLGANGSFSFYANIESGATSGGTLEMSTSNSSLGMTNGSGTISNYGVDVRFNNPADIVSTGATYSEVTNGSITGNVNDAMTSFNNGVIYVGTPSTQIDGATGVTGQGAPINR